MANDSPNACIRQNTMYMYIGSRLGVLEIEHSYNPLKTPKKQKAVNITHLINHFWYSHKILIYSKILNKGMQLQWFY